MAVMKLAHDRDLGVLSLSEFSDANPLLPMPGRTEGPLDTQGWGLQPVAAAVQFPSFVSQAAAAASSWL